MNLERLSRAELSIYLLCAILVWLMCVPLSLPHSPARLETHEGISKLYYPLSHSAFAGRVYIVPKANDSPEALLVQALLTPLSVD